MLATAIKPTRSRALLARAWGWAVVPALAVVAYAPVLGIGFLSDDFALLGEGTRDVTLQSLLPIRHDVFYRPAGMLLTWSLGWHAWGLNPLPYHLQGLLVHAVAALALGLWLAEATSRPGLGWLAGALFAVFPLHTEAVGWLAAQWYALAAMFGVLSLWLFTRWWRRERPPRWHLYCLSLLCYGLGVFSEEVLLAFLPLFALSAWLVSPRFGGMEWRRLAYGLLPFCAVLALNLGLRLATWHRLGGYAGLRHDYWDFAWDGYAAHLRLLLSPINTMVFGNATAQIVGVLSSLVLLAGLAYYGRDRRRLLLVAAAWVTLALLPVLNLPPKADDLQQNRFLYLAAAGYCAGAATLLYEAIASTRRLPAEGRRQKAEGSRQAIGNGLLPSAFCLLLISLGVVACWAQLGPWRTASAQVVEVNEELLRLVPPQPRSARMLWYVENRPDSYKGAYVHRVGLGAVREFTNGDGAQVRVAQHAGEVDLAAETRDAFALRFAYAPDSAHSHVDYAAGITESIAPPSAAEAGGDLALWDFRGCAPEALRSWQVHNAQSSCEPGSGLALRRPTNDAFILGPEVAVDPAASQARFVRLRVSARYPAATRVPGLINQWYWGGPANDWGEARSRSMPIKQDGQAHVYWTFPPASETGGAISRLRFDPANDQIPADIQWIALDLVK